MIALSVNDLSLSIGDRDILKNISFALETHDKLGIIGINGSGKSTLFRLITGEAEPTSGSVFTAKGSTMAILTQDGALRDFNGSDALSPLEQMYGVFDDLIAMEIRMGELVREMERCPDSTHLNTQRATEYAELESKFTRSGGHEFRARSASMLKNLGFSESAMNEPVRNLSGGQRTRLALALQMAREPDILLLDEPTNHLDIETTTWLENYLAASQQCILVVSHDRYFLDRVTNKTLAIQYGRAKLYNGNYTRSMEQRKADRETAEHQFKVQQREIARQEAYIAQQRQWNRERNIIAAESRQKMLDKMVRLERPENDPKPIRLAFTSGIESGNDVLTIRNLTMGFGERTLFSNLNFKIQKREHAFIIGSNGCGKSTLIKLILGRLKPLGGAIDHGTNVEIGYYDQENQNLDPQNTVLEELWSRYPTMNETSIRSTLASFRFYGEDVYKEVSVLSGGERARLTLAKLILSRMNLLVLDEPTNHLDIDSREALETALEAFDGTILAVSHDRYFVEKLATRILEMNPDPVFNTDLVDFHVDHPKGGYTEYGMWKSARIAERTGNTVTIVDDKPLTDSKEQYLKNKKAASDARKKATQIDRLQKEAAELEASIDEWTIEMNGEAATDYKRVAELDTQKTQAEERLLEIYERLEELEAE